MRHLGRNIEKNYNLCDNDSMTLGSCLNKLYKETFNNGLSKELLTKMENEIKVVSQKFGVEDFSAVLLAAFAEDYGCDRMTSIPELADFFGCSNIEFLKYHKCLKDMRAMGILRKNNSGYGSRDAYALTKESFKVIDTDSVFTPAKISGLTKEELFDRLETMWTNHFDDEGDVELLYEDIIALVKNNAEIDFCKQLTDKVLTPDLPKQQALIFVFLCTAYVTDGADLINLNFILNYTYGRHADNVKRLFIKGSAPLQTRGLICFENSNGFEQNERISLSESAVNEILGGLKVKSSKTRRSRDLLSWEAIKEKQLFYNKEEQKQIDRLCNLLSHKNFKEVQERLKKVGMRSGFNAIFYGGPGTGKTACVYELARRCKRDIYLVDVSKLKSKWVGDSEKAVKELFNVYKEACRKSEVAPILLFNEADAIFSKRLETIRNSVDQMNNSIQNIILQEMEDLDGVLIATTNLEGNLDQAFERRFIFKINFTLPDKEQRAKVWKSMIPNITEAEAEKLAAGYNFSGGNIENIARKSMVDYVITGKEPSFDYLNELSQEEMFSKQETVRRKIGF